MFFVTAIIYLIISLMASSSPFPADLQVSEDGRYFANKLVLKDKLIESDFREQLLVSIAKKLKYLEQNYDAYKDEDKDIYVGSGGIAMLYFHLANTYAQSDIARKMYLEKSLALVQHSLKGIKLKKIAFVHGPAGLYSIGAVVQKKLKREAESKAYVHQLVALFENLVKTKQHPSEILYGHAGYLHSLLFVNRFIPYAVNETVIRNVVSLILETGKTGKVTIMDSPLAYSWHSKHYIGGAHGMAGIATQLLQIDLDSHFELRQLLVLLIQYILSVQKTSGNFPSSLESSHRDLLVQFCHGAPGVLPMLCLAGPAAQKLAIERLLESTEAAAEVVWARGLLTKGHGLCHGVSGNAYAFLSLFRHTQDPKHIRQAVAFAEWIMQREDTAGNADSPFSLFEGLAGQIYFLADMLDPMKSAFPGYELPRL